MRKTIQEQRQQNLLFGPIFIDADLICLLVSKERSEEHTSELQSQSNLVCRLLLEKKKEYTAFSLGDAATASTTINERDSPRGVHSRAQLGRAIEPLLFANSLPSPVRMLPWLALSG